MSPTGRNPCITQALNRRDNRKMTLLSAFSTFSGTSWYTPDDLPFFEVEIASAMIVGHWLKANLKASGPPPAPRSGHATTSIEFCAHLCLCSVPNGTCSGSIKDSPNSQAVPKIVVHKK